MLFVPSTIATSQPCFIITPYLSVFIINISSFVEEEKSYFQPLRQTRYKLSQWKVATVGLNYHIQVEGMHYSVPYDYVREHVDIRISTGLIEVYFKEVRIASHKRLKGEIGQYSTSKDHMPDNHRLYLDHNPENNKLWAELIGTSMTELVSYILATNVEKKALNILASLRNLSKKYTNKEMETAAKTLLKLSTNPTVSVLKSILERNKKCDKNKNNITDNAPINDENYGFTRDAKYFGGDDL